MNRLRHARAPLARVLGLALCTAACAGCSSFPRDWKAAIARPVPANSIEGPWEGRWTSSDGHDGALRCLVTQAPPPAGPTPADAPAARYLARFEAKYRGIFTGHLDAVLAGNERDGVATLSGDENLGSLWGGVFHYEARVTPASFNATFRSKDDHGDFIMTRPQPPK